MKNDELITWFEKYNNRKYISQNWFYDVEKNNDELKGDYLYIINNQITNRIYIGKSRNISKRIINHLFECGIPKLKNDFLKYGLNNFNILYKKVENLDVKEMELIRYCSIIEMDLYNRNLYKRKTPINHFNEFIPDIPFTIPNTFLCKYCGEEKQKDKFDIKISSIRCSECNKKYMKKYYETNKLKN